MQRALARAEGSPTDKHQSVHNAFAKNRTSKLPVPWCATLAGDPEQVDDCLLRPVSLVVPYAFNPMERSHEPAAYVWAALRMTRRWKFAVARSVWLNEKKNRKADGTPRKRLPKGEAERIAAKMRPTSLFDFVYELRRRANYETVDEYGAEIADADIGRFHDGMCSLLDTGLLIAETQLAQHIGVRQLEEIADGWTRSARRIGGWAAEPLKGRLKAVAHAL